MLLTPLLLGDVLILSIVALMVWHSQRAFRHGRWLLLDPINLFWAGIFVCYVEQPIRSADIFIAWHSETVFIKTLLATLIGLLCVILGYESRLGPAAARWFPELPGQLSSGRLLGSALLLIAMGVGGYWYLFSISGGLEHWLSVGRGGTDHERVMGYWAEFTTGLPAGVALLVFRAELFRLGLAGRVLAWCAGGVMWLWFLYLGSRSRLIIFTIVLLACYFLPRRRSPRLLLAAGLFVLLQVSVNLQQNYREGFTNLSFNLEQVDREELWRTILPEYLGGNPEIKRAQTTPGSEFNCAMAVVELVPETIPYNFGYGFLEVFTRPIPRALWPAKRYPHMESVQGVLRAADLSSTPVATAQSQELVMGPAFAFVGHWYYVGGFVGIIVGGLVTGVLFRFLRGFYDRSPLNHSVMLTYPFLLSIGFAEAASTPWYWVFTLPFVLLPYLAIVLLCRSHSLQGRRRNGNSGTTPPTTTEPAATA